MYTTTGTRGPPTSAAWAQCVRSRAHEEAGLLDVLILVVVVALIMVVLATVLLRRGAYMPAAPPSSAYPPIFKSTKVAAAPPFTAALVLTPGAVTVTATRKSLCARAVACHGAAVGGGERCGRVRGQGRAARSVCQQIGRSKGACGAHGRGGTWGRGAHEQGGPIARRSVACAGARCRGG
jgi:hypothetical protein